MWTYIECEKFMNKKTKKKLATSTYLIKKDDNFIVQYHWTAVVEISKDNTYKIDTNSWHTKTTKERINTYSPLSIYQNKGVWYTGNNEKYEDGLYSSKGELITTSKSSIPYHLKDKLDVISGFERSTISDKMGKLVYADWCEENSWDDRAWELRAEANKILN